MTIKKINCKRCRIDNYVDLDIVHVDPNHPDIQDTFERHCSYCTKTLEVIGKE